MTNAFALRSEDKRPMKKLLVSFSGGETSAFMAQWLWNHKRDEYDMVFVFANTGQENQETLDFIDKFSKHFSIPIYWVEALVNHGSRKGTSHWLTDYEDAKTEGEPFEEIIKKYGIPNMASPHCTRELKQKPIESFGRQWFDGEPYYLAIGIRADEADRINAKAVEKRLIYPLIKLGTTKPIINLYWSQMPFRLNLKGYQGNCKWCWKKSYPKLLQIAKENPNAFDFPARMEEKYSSHSKINMAGEPVSFHNIKFFRGNRSAKDILELSKLSITNIPDDSRNYSVQYNLDLIGGDSCEVFSECSN